MLQPQSSIRAASSRVAPVPCRKSAGKPMKEARAFKVSCVSSKWAKQMDAPQLEPTIPLRPYVADCARRGLLVGDAPDRPACC